VPLVLPGLILVAIWACAWLAGRARVRGAGPAAWSFVSACCVVALLVPTVVTTTGFALTHSGGSGSLHPEAHGLAVRTTNGGETPAIRQLCGDIGHGSAVVILGQSLADDFAPALRGMCGIPAAWAPSVTAPGLNAILGGIQRRGRRLVLLATSRAGLGRYAASGSLAVSLRTTQDPHELTQPPMAPLPLDLRVWMVKAAPVPAIGT
jgi:hypothetical protein